MKTRLSQILELNGITQRELAARVGVTEASISLLVSGERTGKLDTWIKIAQVLNVQIDDLVYFEGGPADENNYRR